LHLVVGIVAQEVFAVFAGTAEEFLLPVVPVVEGAEFIEEG
jgi:hypothetical protein